MDFKYKLLKINIIFIFIAVLIALAIRIPFLPKNINFNNDAELYSENIEKIFFNGKYDVQVPGYISYIYLGRIINYFVKDPVYTQHIINILLVFLITILFYKLLYLLKFKEYEAFFYSIIFSFINIMFIGSLTGGNRLFLVLCSIALIYISIKIIRDNKNGLILLFSFLLAFFIGFRQDISFYFMPLYIYLFIKIKDLKLIIFSVIIFSFTFFLWFIPLIIEYRGLNAYIEKILNQDAVYNTSIFLSKSKFSAFLNITRVFIYLLNAFLFIYPFIIYSLIKKKYKISKELFVILILSLIPAFIFQLFVHNGNYVHIAAFMVPFFILLIINFNLDNMKKIIFVIFIIMLLLIQFYGVKMLKNDKFYKNVINVLWLQYSYDGIKSGETYRLNDLKDD